MKYISICSGIEAATVAWHGFGWKPLAFSEIEAFPSAVLAHHWPDVPNLGDMTKFSEWPEDLLAECDILVGGPPCQAFSVAGLRKSLDDDRGNITLAYVHLLNHIDATRRRHGRPPVIAVYENVPGLLSTKDNAFGCLVGALCGCDEAPETETGKWPKAGFLCGEARRVGYRVIDAQYFGVAQRRRRIFLVAVPCELVASLGERACPSAILSLRESMRGNPPSRRKPWEGVAADAPGGSSGCVPIGVDTYNQTLSETAISVRVENAKDSLPAVLDTPDCGATQAFGGNRTSGPIDAATTLTAHGGPHGRLSFASDTFVVKQGSAALGFNWQNGGGYGVANDGLGITEEGTGPLQRCNTPAVAFVKATNPHSKDEAPRFEQTECSVCLNGWDERHDPPKHVVAFKESQSGVRIGEVHATIDANKGSRRQEGALSGLQVRRLTPPECCRLQGFPDNHCDIVFRKKPAADGPKYKALGNSMAVPCMWWLGRRIALATQPESEDDSCR